MNTLEQISIRSPADKNETCAKFIIDDVSFPFVFHYVTNVGQKYTLGFYVKSEVAGSLTIFDKVYNTTSEWQKIAITFDSTETNISIFFSTLGTYYLYHTQLEIGNKDTDFERAPEDIEEDIQSVSKKTAELIVDLDAITSRVYSVEQDATSLESRVSTAESKLTKDGLVTTIGSYYTTLGQLNNAIDGIDIGGRNLIRGTKDMSGFYTDSANLITDEDGFTFASFSPSSLKYWKLESTVHPINFSVVRNKEVVLSFYARSDDWESLNASASNGILLTFVLCDAESTTKLRSRDVKLYTCNLSNEWQKIFITATLSDDYFTSGSGTIDDTTRIYIRFNNYSEYSMQVKQFKLEYGNKATDWTPAPEDVESSISHATSIATQTAEKFEWMVRSDSSETSLTLTDSMVEAITDQFKIVAIDGSTTIVEGGTVTTNNIVGENGWINLGLGTFNYGNGALSWDGNTLRIGKLKDDIVNEIVYGGLTVIEDSQVLTTTTDDVTVTTTDGIDVYADGMVTLVFANIDGGDGWVYFQGNKITIPRFTVNLSLDAFGSITGFIVHRSDDNNYVVWCRDNAWHGQLADGSADSFDWEWQNDTYIVLAEWSKDDASHISYTVYSPAKNHEDIKTVAMLGNWASGAIGATTTINGGLIETNSILADKINVIDLFAQDITASGKIRGVELIGAKGTFSGELYSTVGSIGGWNLDKNCLYTSATSAAGETTKVVLQNAVVYREFGVSYVNYNEEDVEVEVSGTYIYVNPLNTKNTSISLSSELYPGTTTVYIYSGYVAKYDDINPSVDISYIDADGNEQWIWYEFAEEWGGTIFDIVDGNNNNQLAVAEINFDINIPDGATNVKLSIRHNMPQAKVGETYVFKTDLKHNGITYETVPTLSSAGVTIDKVLSINKESNGINNTIMHILANGDIYTEGVILSNGGAVINGDIVSTRGFFNEDLTVNGTITGKMAATGFRSYNDGGIQFDQYGNVQALTSTARTWNVKNSDGTVKFSVDFSSGLITSNMMAANGIHIGDNGAVAYIYQESNNIMFRYSNGGTTSYTNLAWIVNAINGKAASSHTHSYLPLSGGTISGSITVTGQVTTNNMYVKATEPWINLYRGGASSFTSRIIETSDSLNIIYQNGGRGIRITHPSAWHVSPTVDKGVNLGGGSYRWTAIYAGSSSINTSDEREKNIIGEISDKYKELFMKLKPIMYTWKDNESTKGIHLGLGAQTTEKFARECGISGYEIGAIIHDYFDEPRSSDGAMDGYGMAYDEFAVLMIPFVQSHDKEIRQLKEENLELRQELEEIKNMISQNKAVSV